MLGIARYSLFRMAPRVLVGAFTKVTAGRPDIDAGQHVVVLQVEDADVSNPKIVLGVVSSENEADELGFFAQRHAADTSGAPVPDWTDSGLAAPALSVLTMTKAALHHAVPSWRELCRDAAAEDRALLYKPLADVPSQVEDSHGIRETKFFDGFVIAIHQSPGYCTAAFEVDNIYERQRLTFAAARRLHDRYEERSGAAVVSIEPPAGLAPVALTVLRRLPSTVSRGNGELVVPEMCKLLRAVGIASDDLDESDHSALSVRPPQAVRPQ